MIKHCVRKPFTVLVGILAVILLGYISFTKMSTDLLPEMDLPYLIVYTTDPGASPEEVEASITKPLESALGTTSGLVNITSTSSENVSIIMMEFSSETDLNGVMVQMNNTFDQLKDALPETAGTPTLMQVSMDMMSTMMLSVDYDGKDVKELSELLNDELLTEFERLDGVASVSSIGSVEDGVTITLDQDKIDDLNDRVLKSVDSELYKAKKELDDAQAQLDASSAQIDSATAKLEKQTGTLADQMGTASAEVDSATSQLNAILSEETTLTANQKAFETEKQAYQQYADMNDQVSTVAALIAIYDATGKLPTTDLNEIESVTDLLATAGTAISDPSSYISDHMTDEDFNAARDQVSELVSGISGDVSSQLSSVSRTDFVKLAAATSKAASRVTEIDAELNNIQTRLAAISAMKPQLEKALETAKQTYAKLESSKISATVGVASGQAQIIAGQGQIQSAQQQLDSAVEQFEAARDEAYKKADISGLITAEMISNILTAENFDMPAGYIKQ
ncbi:MAG: efflux RND transporter permease subunit, partial [Butyricicoccaceae bacterium]